MARGMLRPSLRATLVRAKSRPCRRAVDTRYISATTSHLTVSPCAATLIAMKRRIVACILILGVSISAYARDITQSEAVRLAELFIAANGYTNAPAEQIKNHLDFEDLEWNTQRKALLQLRFDTLKRTAIGVAARPGDKTKRWSVAFDYVESGNSEKCRVVTIGADGKAIRLQHQDGIRRFFVGSKNE